MVTQLDQYWNGNPLGLVEHLQKKIHDSLVHHHFSIFFLSFKCHFMGIPWYSHFQRNHVFGEGWRAIPSKKPSRLVTPLEIATSLERQHQSDPVGLCTNNT
jgi:hypothetical protein